MGSRRRSKHAAAPPEISNRKVSARLWRQLRHRSKCREAPLDHFIGSGQADPKIVRGIHKAAGHDKDVAVCEFGPQFIWVALGPPGPEVKRSFRRQRAVATFFK